MNMKNERDHFIEEASSQRILFRGTKEECDEWYDLHSKEYADKILIIRKGQKNVHNGSSLRRYDADV